MKNRILSCVLAVLMVVSMLTVLAVNASAEEPTGVTLTVGTAYAVAGETAYVDLYASASSIPEELLGLRDWEAVFTLSAGTFADQTEFGFEVTSGSAYGYANVAEQKAGCASAAYAFVAASEKLLAKGGVKIATLAIEVPTGTTENITVSASVNTLSFDDKDCGNTKVAGASVATVPGTIVIVDGLEGVQAAVEGAGEDVVLAPVVDNVVVSKMTKSGKLTGEFGLLTVPATITSVASTAVSGATCAAVNLKGTAYNSATVAPFVEAASVVYYAKRANGTDTTFGALTDYIENESENEPELKNILNVVEGALVADSNVTFTGVITAEDLDFDTVTLVADFGEKVREYEFTTVCKTIKGVASVDEAVATAQGVEFVDGAYLASMTVTGVPAGTYTVNVTLYGTTPDANGNLIWVCSDTVPVEVTVA